jgi:hypothetical protein
MEDRSLRVVRIIRHAALVILALVSGCGPAGNPHATVVARVIFRDLGT